MNRILLVDDSPHAQRMGDRILSDEGYEVVTVSNADSALIRLEDVDPDVILADSVMPGRTGYDICQYVKMSPRHKHVRVILTAGVLEPLDEARTRQVEADATLRKPFEASVLLAAVKPLAEAAARERRPVDGGRETGVRPEPPAAPFVAVVDAEQIQAAVTVALDAAMGDMVAEITKHVVAAFQAKRSAPAPPAPPMEPELPRPAPPLSSLPRIENVRRVNPLRLRSGSILGLAVDPPAPEDPGPGSSE